MYDEGELDDMERLALAARRDPARWGERYRQEQRAAALAQYKAKARADG